MQIKHWTAVFILFLAVAPNASAASAKNDLLLNVDFESVTSAGFEGWNCSQGNGGSWDDVPLKPSKDAKSGKFAAALPSPPDGQLLLFRQRLPAEKLAHETTLRLTFWAKAFTPDQLHVVVAFKCFGLEKKVRATHPGNGEWKDFKVYFDLPASADLGTVELQVLVRPGSDQPALIDDIHFWHEEIAPKYALPKNIKP